MPETNNPRSKLWFKLCVHGVADGLFCLKCAEAMDKAEKGTVFKIPADDVERANIGTVNPDCPQCRVWGFECKLPKCGPQVNVWGFEEMEKPKLDDLLPPHLRMDRKPVISMLSEEPRAFKLDEKGTIVPNPEYAEWQKSEKHKYVARAMYEDRPATQADFKREISKLTGEEIFHKPVTSLNYCARASLAKQPWKCSVCHREIFSKESHIKGCVGREIYTDDGKAIINWSVGTVPMKEKKQEVSQDRCWYGLGEGVRCRLPMNHSGEHEVVPNKGPVRVEKKPYNAAAHADFHAGTGGEEMLPWKVIPFIAIVVIVLMGIFYHD